MYYYISHRPKRGMPSVGEIYKYLPQGEDREVRDDKMSQLEVLAVRPLLLLLLFYHRGRLLCPLPRHRQTLGQVGQPGLHRRMGAAKDRPVQLSQTWSEQRTSAQWGVRTVVVVVAGLAPTLMVVVGTGTTAIARTVHIPLHEVCTPTGTTTRKPKSET